MVGRPGNKAITFSDSCGYSRLYICTQACGQEYTLGTPYVHTIDWEIFTIKIICIKIFRGVKFLWFRSIGKNFLKVDGYNMDEHLESSWRLVYYQVSREPGIAGCSCQSDIYFGGVWTCVHMLIH